VVIFVCTCTSRCVFNNDLDVSLTQFKRTMYYYVVETMIHSNI